MIGVLMRVRCPWVRRDSLGAQRAINDLHHAVLLMELASWLGCNYPRIRRSDMNEHRDVDLILSLPPARDRWEDHEKDTNDLAILRKEFIMRLYNDVEEADWVLAEHR